MRVADALDFVGQDGEDRQSLQGAISYRTVPPLETRPQPPEACASSAGLRAWRMKIFLFVFAATVLEAAGDGIVRIALHHQSLSTRIGLFLVAYVLLAVWPFLFGGTRGTLSLIP